MRDDARKSAPYRSGKHSSKRSTTIDEFDAEAGRCGSESGGYDAENAQLEESKPRAPSVQPLSSHPHDESAACAIYDVGPAKGHDAEQTGERDAERRKANGVTQSDAAKKLRQPGIDAAWARRMRAQLAAGTPMAQVLNSATDVLFTADLARLQQSVRRELLGAGATIAPLLEDPHTTDVLVNGPENVWVDRGAGLMQVSCSGDPELATEKAVRALAVRLAAQCGQRLDDASPIVDGTFPSGIRLHAMIPPLSSTGTLISLRVHHSHVLTIEELVASGTLVSGLVPLVCALVEKKANVMISGATGAGKTTFLNSMLSLVEPNERIVIIEEAAELAPSHPHVVHMQVRHANVQGVGEISMSELVKAAMRMRPDRIVLGECRGEEVRDVLSALNTGHEGGWATIHANSASDVPARLVALGALANMSENTVAAQVAAALDAVIHIRRSSRGRYVSQIATFERQHSGLICPCAFAVDPDRQEIRASAYGQKLCAQLDVPMPADALPLPAQETTSA
ncbi:MAG: TadA family conjugal transfer-associated ATPase [Actinomycetaceae bacterium]|nr:TadA family conjugal transfer-associated ATPase [Arcanobacterium sp.]MDD7687602.1 TadA family conjugal transfer-associated ATPase [Actinomycetaceae bacterium]MDY5273160.1 TadA family conjugal transfer-associated ATPase [Arcanobacterium sp.]